MSGWTDGRLDQLTTRGDPVADDLVSHWFDERDEHRTIELLQDIIAHERPVSAGESRLIEDFLDRPVELPGWATGPGADELLQRGQDVFALYGLQIGSALYCASLPEGYASPTVADTLWRSAELVSDPRRRIAETGQFLVDVMEHGGLEPGAAGWRAIRRVRLVHAAVRHLAAEAVPGVVAIDQEQLLGTFMTFTWVPFRVIERYGMPLTEADQAAYLHTWNVIGFHLGVAPDLLPLTLDDLAELEPRFRARHQSANGPGVMLTDALVTMLAGYVPRWLPFLRGFPASTVRFLVGDEVADLTAVPPADWTLRVLRTLGGDNGLARLVPQRSRVLRRVGVSTGRFLLKRFVTTEMEGQRAEFALPTHLVDAWKLRRVRPRTRPPADALGPRRVDGSFRPGFARSRPAALGRR